MAGGTWKLARRVVTDSGSVGASFEAGPGFAPGDVLEISTLVESAPAWGIDALQWFEVIRKASFIKRSLFHISRWRDVAMALRELATTVAYFDKPGLNSFFLKRLVQTFNYQA